MTQDSDYPTDAEIQRWEKEYKRLVGARQQVVDNRREAERARDVVRLKAVRAGQQLERLMWSERAFANKIAGPIEGGVSFVG